MEPGLIHVEVQKGAFLGEALPVLVMREGPAREQVPTGTCSPAQPQCHTIQTGRNLSSHGLILLPERTLCDEIFSMVAEARYVQHRVADAAMHTCSV